MIEYRISCADIYRHHFVIECRIAEARETEDLTLPSWIPGSYLLREFARHVVGVEASSNGLRVATQKISSNTWRCRGLRGDLRFVATIYALDKSVRGSYLDVTRGYFNGPCVFVCPKGREDEPIEILIERPNDPTCAAWKVASALQPVGVDEGGFGRYRADGYDELIDHPVEISEHQSVEFTAAGVQHELVVAGSCETDLDRVATDLGQLCTCQIEFFGGAPFRRYVFLGLAVDQGHGGLEHRASSSLIFARDDLPRPGEPGIPTSYQRFLALASHEYFHTWHVKRSKPEAFMPYRLSERNYTRLLWVFEGITSYYQELFLLRSDLLDANAFLRRLAELLTRVYRTPGRKVQSISDASFDAWDVLYKPDANSPNAAMSYYSKGALVALALDLELRLSSDSAMTLDELVKQLWRRFGRPGIGVPEDGFEALACELGGSDLEEFFERAVRGTEDLALDALLAEFGVEFALRPARDADDKGGTPARGDGPNVALGLAFAPAPLGIMITNVLNDGPAQSGGLNPGDLLIAINRLQVSASTLDARLSRFVPGERVLATVLRDGELLGFTLTLSPPPADSCYLALRETADAAIVDRRRAWLGI